MRTELRLRQIVSSILIFFLAFGDFLNITIDSQGNARLGPSQAYANDGGDGGAGAGSGVPSQASVTTLSTSPAELPSATGAETTSSGDLSYNVPFMIPEYRGLEPSLGLAYRSRRTGSVDYSSLVGAGWRMTGFSSIRRGTPGRGLPTWDAASDIYLLDGEELVDCAGITSPGCAAGGTHATQVENYQRIAFDSTDNTWTVTRRNGTKAVYKPLEEWSSTNPSTTAQIRQLQQNMWMLAEVEDTNGNKVTYAYTIASEANGFAPRPDTVSYNGTIITFHYQDRGDDLTYANGIALSTIDKRMSAVKVTRLGATVRAYNLTFSERAVTSRSMLDRIDLYGNNAVITNAQVSSGTPMQSGGRPYYAFSYANPAPYNWVTGGASVGFNAQVADLDGDGRPDLVSPSYRTDATQQEEDYVQLPSLDEVSSSNAITSSSYDSDFRSGVWVPQVNPDGVREESTVSFGNYDGDPTDIEAALSVKHGRCPSEGSTCTSWQEFRIFKADTTGLGQQLTTWIVPGGFSTIDGWIVYEKYGDFDGDGQTEVFVWDDGESGIPVRFLDYPSQNGGWTYPGNETSLIGDFNGDGRSDVLGPQGLHFSNGSGFLAPVTGTPYWDTETFGARTGDFNGDGMSDVISQVGTTIYVALSNGHGFETPIAWLTGATKHLKYGRVGDFDGDGVDDVFLGDYTAPQWPYNLTYPGNGTLYRSTGASFNSTGITKRSPALAISTAMGLTISSPTA